MASSTVMTPSLPTFSIASAMIWPIDSSLFAEIVPTWRIALPTTGRESFLISPDAYSTAFSTPRLTSIGLRAGGDGLHALAEDRLREDGRGRRAVAGDVRRLRGDLTNELGAHVLAGGPRDSISFATETPSLVERRAELLLEDDVPALGAAA